MAVHAKSKRLPKAKAPTKKQILEDSEQLRAKNAELELNQAQMAERFATMERQCTSASTFVNM